MNGSLRSLGLALVLAALVLLSGCSDPDESGTEQERTTVPDSTERSETTEAILTGQWVRQPGEPCADLYPLELDIRDQVYTAVNDPEQPLGPLDSGDLEIVDAETIRLMNPIDAMATYGYRVSERELVLTDESGCEVVFLRLAGS